MCGDEQAKSLGEAAKAAQEGTKALRELGGFFGRYLDGPLRQASHILEDRLQYMRIERLLRLQERFECKLAERNLAGNFRRIEFKVAVPLLEAASLENDEYLQGLWAELLANAVDPAVHVDVTKSFVSILSEFGPLEAKLLQFVVNAPDEVNNAQSATVNTQEFPNYTPSQDVDKSKPSDDVKAALWNLHRLGCIVAAPGWDGTMFVQIVTLTTLGDRLVRACTPQAK
jgi:hypothetical protein